MTCWIQFECYVFFVTVISQGQSSRAVHETDAPSSLTIFNLESDNQALRDEVKIRKQKVDELEREISTKRLIESELRYSSLITPPSSI